MLESELVNSFLPVEVETPAGSRNLIEVQIHTPAGRYCKKIGTQCVHVCVGTIHHRTNE